MILSHVPVPHCTPVMLRAQDTNCNVLERSVVQFLFLRKRDTALLPEVALTKKLVVKLLNSICVLLLIVPPLLLSV